MAEMIGKAPRSTFTGIPGWLTEKEEQALMLYASRIPAEHDGICTRVVEIGSEYGRSAGAFCKAARPEVSIHCIDLFPDDMQATHRHNLDAAGFEDRTIMYHQGDSHAFPYFHWGVMAQPGIDLLFIDGDHHFEGVMADLKFWPHFVQVGWHLLLHDVANSTNTLPHEQHYEVTRAIREWWQVNKQDWIWIEDVDSLTIFKRIGRHA